MRQLFVSTFSFFISATLHAKYEKYSLYSHVKYSYPYSLKYKYHDEQ